MGKKPVVTLRVYRGKQMSYDAQGNVQNENQTVSLIHDTVEWKNFMKNLAINGYLKVDVEKVQLFDKNKDADGFFVTEFSPYDNKDIIKKEVDTAYKSQTTPQMSAADRKIAELEAKINALLAKSEDAVIVKEPKETSASVEGDLDELREKYTEINGKKPFSGWDADKLREKISELSK